MSRLNDTEISPVSVIYLIISTILCIVVMIVSHSGFKGIVDILSNIVSNFNVNMSMSEITQINEDKYQEIFFFLSLIQTTYISRLVRKLIEDASIVDNILMFLGTSILTCFINISYTVYPISFLNSIWGVLPFIILMGAMYLYAFIRAMIAGFRNSSILIGLLSIFLYIFVNPVFLGLFAIIIPFFIEMYLYACLYDAFWINHPVLMMIFILLTSYPANLLTGALTEKLINLSNGNETEIPFTDIIYGLFSFGLIISWFVLVFIKNDVINIQVDFDNQSQVYTVEDVMKKGNISDNVWWEFYKDGTLVINGGYSNVKMQDFSFTSSPWYEFAQNIKRVVIQDEISYIGSCAFSGCKNLNEIYIGKNVKEIGNYALDDCASLQKIIVDKENKVYSADDGMLFTDNMRELVLWACGKQSITLPDTVEKISCRFYSYVNLEKIEVDKNNMLYAAVDGILYSKDKKSLIYCPIGKKGKCVVDKNVEKIEQGAFEYCSEIDNIILQKGVKDIEAYAFNACRKLKEIDIPENVRSIGYAAFMDCEELHKIKLMGDVPKIGENAFLRVNAVLEYPKNQNKPQIQENNWGGEIKWKGY